ncbi:MAG: hypothetical protein U0641_16930 [Anaerolineae bacterium]
MMTSLMRAQPAAEPTVSPAREMLEALDLTPALPDLLAKDKTGRPFEPVQLVVTEDIRRLPEQYAMVMRPEPVGGAEAMVQANRVRVAEAALSRLYQRLAARPQGTPTQSLLRDLQAETRAVKDEVQAARDAVEAEFADLQERLHKWQARMDKHSGGFFDGLFGWVVGGDGNMSLAQAITLWNKREHVALARATHGAATGILTQFLDAVTYLAEHQESLLVEGRTLQAEVREKLDALARRPTGYTPWTFQVQATAVVEALAGQSNVDALMTRLLDRLWSGGEVTLASAVQEMATQEAARRLGALDLPGMIEAEASRAPAEDADAVVLVGQHLLEKLTTQPTWQLTPGAKPRIETLQVTPNGKPVYSHDDLGTATYGDRNDRLAFVQVQLEVAMDEVKALSEGDDTFQATLQQRNLYVLEDLAEAVERKLAASAATPPAAEKAPISSDVSASISGNGLGRE